MFLRPEAESSHTLFPPTRLWMLRETVLHPRFLSAAPRCGGSLPRYGLCPIVPLHLLSQSDKTRSPLLHGSVAARIQTVRLSHADEYDGDNATLVARE